MQMKTSVALALTGVFAIGGATLGADEMTLTCTVGDAACGVTHIPRRLSCAPWSGRDAGRRR